ncbi:hypothetical protein [Herbidospora yilanensis]|uniref:hypothetical protein n=1 Tax=Herbidospora yilanensis TaxID=354426 RepID=UPI000783485F|nr:hypothetical protein [Herbidospora yilanensis]
MSTAFAAAIRERAQRARQALLAARGNGDAHAVLLAEEEWDDVRRLAQAHSLPLPDNGDIDSKAAEA